LQLFTELIAPTPIAICIKYHDFERPMNSSSNFVNFYSGDALFECRSDL
jgi:hypothetical protein